MQPLRARPRQSSSSDSLHRLSSRASLRFGLRFGLGCGLRGGFLRIGRAEVGRQADAQVDRSGLLAGEVDSVDEEEHLVALEAVDELDDGAVVAGDAGVYVEFRERVRTGEYGNLRILPVGETDVVLL